MDDSSKENRHDGPPPTNRGGQDGIVRSVATSTNLGRSNEGSRLENTETAAPSSRAANERTRQEAFFDEDGFLIARLMAGVPVPPGLAERVLQRLKAAKTPNPPHGLQAPCPMQYEVEAFPAEMIRSNVASPPASCSSLEERPADNRREATVSRRRLLVLALATSLLVVIAFVGLLSRFIRIYFGPKPVLEVSQLLEQAVSHFHQELVNYRSGQSVAVELPPKEFPLSSFVRVDRSVYWRWIVGVGSGKGVSYDLTKPPQPPASLFVLNETVQGLPPIPVSQPMWNTGSCVATAWAESGRVYILVVAGGINQYRYMISGATRPIT